MIAAGLLANGAKVYISSRKAEQCDATATRLSETYGGECVSIPADLSTMEGIGSLANAIAESETQVDILVNNAGVSWGAPIEEFPEKGWDKVFDTNVKGVFFLTQQLLPLLEAGATGDDPSRVVNIGSIDGLRAPIFDTHSYGPSKAAVHALTREMATKLVKRNIVLNAIAPGHIMTENMQRMWREQGNEKGYRLFELQYPVRRTGSPDDITHAVAFLCSPQAAFINGVLLPIDGGMSIQLQENIVMELVDYIRENPELRSHFDGYKLSPKRH